MPALHSTFLALLIGSFLCSPLFGQEEEEFIEVPRSNEGEWGGIPGMNGGGITLIDQNSFLVLMGAASASYLIAEFLTDTTQQNFYQSRLGVFGVSNKTTIVLESFGIEKRVAPWFGLGLELTWQQWLTRIPETRVGMGMGLNTYYRWHLLSKYKLSPFLEYGAGVFYGFKKLPYNGSHFTFHLTTTLGLEYRLENQNRFRLSYGHLHQSNNELVEPNPGLDGGGLQMTLLWHWK